MVPKPAFPTMFPASVCGLDEEMYTVLEAPRIPPVVLLFVKLPEIVKDGGRKVFPAVVCIVKFVVDALLTKIFVSALLIVT